MWHVLFLSNADSSVIYIILPVALFFIFGFLPRLDRGCAGCIVLAAFVPICLLKLPNRSG